MGAGSSRAHRRSGATTPALGQRLTSRPTQAGTPPRTAHTRTASSLAWSGECPPPTPLSPARRVVGLPRRRGVLTGRAGRRAGGSPPTVGCPPRPRAGPFGPVSTPAVPTPRRPSVDWPLTQTISAMILCLAIAYRWSTLKSTDFWVDIDVYLRGANALLLGEDLYAGGVHGLKLTYHPFHPVLFTPLPPLPLPVPPAPLPAFATPFGLGWCVEM